MKKQSQENNSTSRLAGSDGGVVRLDKGKRKRERDRRRRGWSIFDRNSA
jgi:hypothetical protein